LLIKIEHIHLLGNGSNIILEDGGTDGKNTKTTKQYR